MKSHEVNRTVTTFLKKNAFIIFTLLITLVAVIMLLFYYFHFKDIGLSDSTLDWANFGSYFGSITGLLAFAGVLYTASLSEKRAEEAKMRAEKAEEEGIKREERDQFFKILELLRDHSRAVVALKNGKFVSDGALAFDNYVKEINAYLYYELIKNFIINLNKESYGVLIINSQKPDSPKQEFYSHLLKRITYITTTIDINGDPSYNSHLVDIEKVKEKINEEINEELCINLISESSDLFFYREYIDELYSDFGFTINNKTIYNSIDNTASILFKKNGIRLDNYCNTFKEILGIINKYISKDNYYSILVSQLSRNQLVLLFIYSFSRFSNKSFVENLLKHKVLYELVFSDLVLFNSTNYENKQNLWEIIADLHIQYLDKH